MEKIPYTDSIPDMTEDTPAQRKESAKKLVEFLERSGLMDKIDTFQKRQTFIKTITPEIAEDLLERMNGIIVGTPIHQREIYKYPGVVIDDNGELIYAPPSPSGQRNIFRNIVIPGFKDVQFPDNAEIAATSINLLHMFQDGNGRLARAIYFIFGTKNKIDHSDEILEDMADFIYDKNSALNFNPQIIQPDLNAIVEQMTPINDSKVHAISHITNIPPKEDQGIYQKGPEGMRSNLNSYMHYVLTKDRFDAIFGLREFIFNRRKNPWEFMVPVSGQESFAIDCDKLLSSITSHEDYLFCLAYLDVPKTSRIQALFEIYKNPNKYQSTTKGVSVRDFYRESIRHHFKHKSN